MKIFAELVAKLEEAETNELRAGLLKQYFAAEVKNSDKRHALALLLGKPQRRYVNSQQLREWGTETAGLPEWLFEESYAHVGDLAETVALIIPKTLGESQNSLTDWIEMVDSLEALDAAERKSRVIAAWNVLPRPQILLFNKLISGGFRSSISRSLLSRAIAELHGLEAGVVEHRLMDNWQPGVNSFSELTTKEDELAGNSRTYPFCAAQALDVEPQELGPCSEWQAEWKWEGLRAQIVKRNGALFVWSRAAELMTDLFPEFSVLLEKQTNDFVIDGEIIALFDGKIQPFYQLQRRLGRKTVGKKLLKDVPVALIAYDLLELDGQDMRPSPLHARRAALVKLVNSLQTDCLQLTEPLNVHSWAELVVLQKQSRQNRAAGIIIKQRNSSYTELAERGPWWAWKVDPFTIDAVLIYAQRENSRSAENYNEFTFAVWDAEDNLVPLAKAYSGLTESELREIASFVKDNTLERFGPVRTVKAELVFELAFEGIQESKRHKSGVSLRFPRIQGWRKDKPKEAADTLARVKQLLKTVNGHFT